MVSLADAPVNLFGDKLPSFDEIKTLWHYVNSGEATRNAFREQAAAHGDALASGIGLLLCGETAAAIEKISSGSNCPQKQMALGYACRLAGDFDAAIAAFDAAAKTADGPVVLLEKCETYRAAGRLDEAQKALDACSNFADVSAEYHYQLGKLLDAQGEYDAAMDNYEKALELDESHARATFQLAYSYDLRGDEEEAAHYYREVVKQVPVHINALLNLAVLYEDTGKYEKAEACIRSVLASHPNHAKARLFQKDIRSSKVMIYDEEHEKRRTRQHKTLEIPISDFELSVRSRNCLKKMNIITLGDLLKTTEAELLSYKNFGETSLFEIKKILDIKGLRLGMALEDQGAAKPIDPEIASQASPEILEKTIGDLELSVRARRALDRLGVKTILELISKTEAELLGCKNFGVTSLNEIKERLTDMGLSLRKLE